MSIEELAIGYYLYPLVIGGVLILVAATVLGVIKVLETIKRWRR